MSVLVIISLCLLGLWIIGALQGNRFCWAVAYGMTYVLQASIVVAAFIAVVWVVLFVLAS